MLVIAETILQKGYKNWIEEIMNNNSQKDDIRKAKKCILTGLDPVSVLKRIHEENWDPDDPSNREVVRALWFWSGWTIEEPSPSPLESFPLDYDKMARYVHRGGKIKWEKFRKDRPLQFHIDKFKLARFRRARQMRIRLGYILIR